MFEPDFWPRACAALLQDAMNAIPEVAIDDCLVLAWISGALVDTSDKFEPPKRKT
jgi:hypothetical protein